MPKFCQIDAELCITCPLIIAHDAVPAHINFSANIGWNAGANSAAEIVDQNLHLVIPVPMNVQGVICGLRASRVDPTSPARISYAFYFTIAVGVNFWIIREHGYSQTNAVERLETDTFEIRRLGGLVQYLVNDIVVYQSTNRSYGLLIATGCLYCSGDSIQ